MRFAQSARKICAHPLFRRSQGRCRLQHPRHHLLLRLLCSRALFPRPSGRSYHQHHQHPQRSHRAHGQSHPFHISRRHCVYYCCPRHFNLFTRIYGAKVTITKQPRFLYYIYSRSAQYGPVHVHGCHLPGHPHAGCAASALLHPHPPQPLLVHALNVSGHLPNSSLNVSSWLHLTRL